MTVLKINRKTGYTKNQIYVFVKKMFKICQNFPWSITVLLSPFLDADIMMKTVRVTMIQYIFAPGRKIHCTE